MRCMTATGWVAAKSAWAFAPRTPGLCRVQLRDLLDRSENLYRRIARLDDILFGEGDAPLGARGHLDTLAQAFRQ